jgi:chromosome segregation ATPase
VAEGCVKLCDDQMCAVVPKHVALRASVEAAKVRAAEARETAEAARRDALTHAVNQRKAAVLAQEHSLAARRAKAEKTWAEARERLESLKETEKSALEALAEAKKDVEGRQTRLKQLRAD